jgi:hypothetical protein
MVGRPLREAPNEGMRRCGLEALLLSPRESASVGKCRPQRAPQEMLRAGVPAAQESAPTILRDPAPGHFEEGPPWDIRWDPGRKKKFNLKRPFEANNEGDDTDHIGHKKTPGHTKLESEQQCHKDQISHIPLPLHLSSRAAAKIVKHPGLEPEREGVVRVLWQHKTLHTQPPCDELCHCHANSRVWRRVARLATSRAWTSNKMSRGLS